MLPEHLSYSQYNSYVQCPRSWYLGKVRGGEDVQTWYIPVGSAVHSMIEAWLDPDHTTPADDLVAESFFYPLIQAQMEIEPDTSKWLAGGPADDPIVEEKALQMVQDCFEGALEYLEDIDVWEVEYDASGRLPGLEVPIKAYVDIIGEHKKKGPVILDWKTGSTKPGSFQLETYAALLRTQFDDSSNMWQAGGLGRYVMLSPRYDSVTRHVDLSKVDPREVGKKYQAVYDQMKKKVYRANPGFGCNYCFQQANCLEKAGPTRRAKYYDRSDRDGIPY